VPGLACAQLILTGENARARWAKTDPEVAHGASPLGAVATVAAYTEGADHLAAVVDYLDRGRVIFAQTLAESLPEAAFRPPEGTYLGWLDLRPTGCDPADVKKLAGVLGVNGRACGEPGHLRLNLATPHHVVREMAERLSACRRVV
jgi:cystathionine beta-lyase